MQSMQTHTSACFLFLVADRISKSMQLSVPLPCASRSHAPPTRYNLSVGCQPASDLQYVYEGHPGGLSPLPTFGVVAAHPILYMIPLEELIPAYDLVRTDCRQTSCSQFSTNVGKNRDPT